MTGKPDTRDSLIQKALLGDISPDDAEAEAKRLGLGPLAHKPKESCFDPMSEPRWTLPMAMAWIVWRLPRQVLLFWDEYRLKCWAWRRLVGRHHLVQDSRATLRQLLLRAERSAEAEAEVKAPKTKIVKSVMSGRSAKAELWRALQEGTLQATGINFDTGRRVPIPDFEWHDLENVEEQGHDIVRVRNTPRRSPTRNPGRGSAARLVAQLLNGRDGVDAKSQPTVHEYTNVVVKRTEIMTLWRSLEHTPTDAPPVDDPAGDIGNRLSGYFLLPQSEPTGGESKRAYRALLQKFPDKRVPKISVQKLADSLTPILRTKGRPVGRDAVRRALGQKK